MKSKIKSMVTIQERIAEYARGRQLSYQQAARELGHHAASKKRNDKRRSERQRDPARVYGDTSRRLGERE